MKDKTPNLPTVGVCAVLCLVELPFDFPERKNYIIHGVSQHRLVVVNMNNFPSALLVRVNHLGLEESQQLVGVCHDEKSIHHDVLANSSQLEGGETEIPLTDSTVWVVTSL